MSWKSQLESSLSRCTSPRMDCFLLQEIFGLREIPFLEGLWPQLATLSLQGRPSNRTIAFRGLLRDCGLAIPDSVGHCLVFTTDLRSTKVQEILGNPSASLCWYFPETREQYRFSSSCFIIPPPASEIKTRPLAFLPETLQDPLRLSFWSKLSNKTRAQFAWPSPKNPLLQDTVFEESVPDDGSVMANDALQNFCLLVVVPDEVEYLNIGVFPNKRVIERLENGASWASKLVNP